MGLFVIDLLIVAFIAWYRPKHLIYDKDSHERETINQLQARYDANTDDTETLRNFWKKDGILNQQNEDIIKSWMKNNQINTSITLLLHEKQYQNDRTKLIAELKLRRLV